ncbi:MAG: UvrD-helicase domain-containing protein [Elusimicrobiota bacterium]
MKPSDEIDRSRARLSLESSVIVEAGAGTGKTTLLTDRIIFLLLARESSARIEEVVALTFTEKAAGEIKVRLSQRLAELAARLSGGALPEQAARRAEATLEELRGRFQMSDERSLERIRAALEDLDKAPIGTIHSFCSQILRLYPVEAGVDPGFRVDEGEGFDELFKSQWARWLDVELGERPPRAARWLELLAVVTLDELEELARGLCAERVDYEFIAGPDPISAQALRALANSAGGLAAGRVKPRGAILQVLSSLEQRLSAAAAAAAAQEPALDACDLDDLPGAKWPESWKDDAVGAAAYERLRLVAKSASPGGEALTRRAARLLAAFAAGFRREYARRGWVSFDGLLRRARDLVRDQPRVREELKRRFAAILVDEFQDTDPLQGELLLYLSEKLGRCAGSWKEISTAPGRLFVVGDPKQSIYRFRGADIGAYEGFVGILKAQGALVCGLTANFRSVPEVIAPVNEIFSRVMLAEPGMQPAYRAIDAAREGSGPAVRVAAVRGSKEGGDAASCQRAEAAWVSRRILEGGRPLKDYAVLLRSSSVLPAYLDAFKRASIAYAVEIERHFYGAPEVGDLLNLLRALDDPDDRIALAGLLRSPLAALDDDGLLSMARARALDYRKDPGGRMLASADKKVVAELFAALRELRARAGRDPLGEFIASALERTRFLELAARAYHGQQTVSNLLKLQRMASQACESRGATLRDFISETRDSARQSPREGESPLADERLEAVRIMTMHKSKGLEFAVVFAANLCARPASGDKPAVRPDWTTGRCALRVGSASSAAAALAEAREKDMAARESVRLIYVAMTRAKEELILLGREKPDSGSLASHLDAAGAWPADGAARGLPVTWIDAGQTLEPAAARTPQRTGVLDAGEVARLWSVRESRRAASEQPRSRAATSYLNERRASEGRVGAEDGDAAGAEVGRLCHLVLQGWDFSSREDPSAAVAKARILLERSSPGPSWARAERQARSILSDFLLSSAARELSSVEMLGREIPFAFAAEKTVIRGAADLIYRTKGKIVVVDFKSEEVDEARAGKIRKKYAEQGRAYLDAVRRAWAQEAEFRILFLRRPEL